MKKDMSDLKVKLFLGPPVDVIWFLGKFSVDIECQCQNAKIKE